MRKLILLLIFPVMTIHAQGFDQSWIEKNVHEGCTFIESKSFMERSINWSIDADPYGEAIGATNGLLDSEERTPEGIKFHVSYYKCPQQCFKNGASKENGMLGKEDILQLINISSIDCKAKLVVEDFLEVDFDNDGYKGYAMRYQIFYGGNQGSQGHLVWNVAFIKNSSGQLTELPIKNENLGEGVENSFYHKIMNKNQLIIQYYIVDIDGNYKIINKNYSLNNNILVSDD